VVLRKSGDNHDLAAMGLHFRIGQKGSRADSAAIHEQRAASFDLIEPIEMDLALNFSSRLAKTRR
jgi:hypothetical protein